MLLPSLHRWFARLAPAESCLEPDLRRHVPALDAVRGLAILAVTVYRFGGGSEGPASVGEPVIPFVELGARGVDLFFVLSGFLITGILFDAKEKPRYFLNFYARRTLRIFPLYYGVLAVALLLLPGNSALQPAREHSWWLWLYGANVLQAWRGEWCLGWFNHFWSLAVEEHFYLLWPAAIYGLSQRNAKQMCAALFIGALAGRIAWLRLGGNNVAPEVFTLLRMDGLAAGAYLALAAREEGRLRRFVRPAAALLLLTSLLLVPMTILHLRLLTLVDSLWTIGCAAGLVLLVTAAPHTRLAGIARSGVLLWLGKYSYGMYVFANLLIPLLAGWLTAAGLANMLGSPLAGQLSYLAIMSAVTALCALVSWHLYEKHFLKAKALFQ